MQTTAIMLNPAPTAQEIFDAVVAHAAKMPCKSVIGGGIGQFCTYRSETPDGDGNACFAGALATDDEVNGWDRLIPAGDGGFDTIVQRGLAPERLLPHQRLISALQHIHDSYEMHRWGAHLRELADEFKLSSSSVNFERPGLDKSLA